MTFSIGFRAPSHAELLTAYIDDHICELNETLRYQDPILSSESNCGEISIDAINNIQEILLSQFSDKVKITNWFGQFITEYLSEHESIPNKKISFKKFLIQFKENKILRRPATLRANYYIDKHQHISLYVNGTKQDTLDKADKIIMLFCNNNILRYDDIKLLLADKNTAKTLFHFYSKGYLEFQDE